MSESTQLSIILFGIFGLPALVVGILIGWTAKIGLDALKSRQDGDKDDELGRREDDP